MQEEFDFLAAYRIQDKAQLKAISDAAKEHLLENSRARKQLRKEMLPYEKMLLLLNKLQEKQMEAELYQEGVSRIFSRPSDIRKSSWTVKRNGIFLVRGRTDRRLFL